MEKIPINISKADLEEQYRFLKNFAIKNTLKRHTPFLVVLSAWLLTDAYLFILAPLNSFITAKGFMYFISFAALPFIALYMIIIVAEHNRNNKAIAEEIEQHLQNKETVLISIELDKFVYTTQKYKGEIQWENFSYFLASDSAIWLHPGHLIPSCPPLSIQSIGKENFEKLKTIVEQKLQKV